MPLYLACDYLSTDPLFNYKPNCDLLDPVLTDFGICYAFNPYPSTQLLAQSYFKNTFNEVYKSDFKNKKHIKASGAGENFALRMILNNGGYMRGGSDPLWPFKLSISSRMGYFGTSAISKKIKPGYETIFNIQPMEIVATEDLAEVPEKARKCKFPNEIESGGMFQ